jgi:hypothetical protein
MSSPPPHHYPLHDSIQIYTKFTPNLLTIPLRQLRGADARRRWGRPGALAGEPGLERLALPPGERAQARGSVRAGGRRAARGSASENESAQKLSQLQPFISVPYRNAWANSHRLGQPNTFLAAVRGGAAGQAELVRSA